MMSNSETASEHTRRRKVIFCDFDGTITENDNIIAIVKHFNPLGWESIVDDIVSQRITIKDGVGKLFRLLPASQREEVIAYAIGNARIRNGFAELLEYCKLQDIEFLVTSGGIDFFVYPLLAPFDISVSHIYCNGSDFSGDQIEITWPNPCDEHCSNSNGCGMCKTTIIRRYPEEQYIRILIGDSVTDFAGAKLAEIVYSRSYLTVKCKELGLPYIEYETFHHILDDLKARQSRED
ncbi:2-hydroxy-3-keto-5-methylthiopentenyl-1-phosphatephosphatase [Paenibacillus plantiphilus]|uniref:2-hydroxy-3-keto-5-methylthiopentenyl-1-phosphate phosphatase n=1 Tax=Paenibacillus plantiphilus TaxID=2905650 RepID=A0ABN8G0M9_9BACL|nr:2-hydroxy-3-keto-5-methylthiopentenyl-1-phosphate phosphatase [Paenibacillus plantiphilus]CAH1196040.1 2-hydroxy-3-keto-5-methylthiopentenyl-1-phosphatephosphatase [Paenibacillus plantiphilus]